MATTLSLPTARPNPLAMLSSYTYQLTFYIVDKEVINIMASNGNRLPMDKSGTGWYIVAQSGGLLAREPRALTYAEDELPVNSGATNPANAGLDYYIDDLNFETLAMVNKGTTLGVEFRFNIVEPTGFTFLTRLSELVGRLGGNWSDKVPAAISLANQHYVLGIRFFGWDHEGKVAKEIPPPGQEPSGDLSDSNKPSGLYEKFYPLVVESMKFKLDGKGATVYNISGLAKNQSATQVSVNVIPKTIGVPSAGTVKEAADSLADSLNDYWQSQVRTNERKIPHKVKIEFVDPEIANARLITDEEVQRIYKHTGVSRSGTQRVTVRDVTAAASMASNTAPVNAKRVEFTQGQTVTDSLDGLIAHSTFVLDALVQNNRDYPDGGTERRAASKPLDWFIVNPVVKMGDYDTMTNQWTYDITLYVKKYRIAALFDPSVPAYSNYYGPHKRYEYTFTGNNTEVISFEQEFNNQYYVIQPISAGQYHGDHERAGPVPVIPSGQTDANAKMSKQARGDIISRAVKANLYSLADQAQIQGSLTILGDPDFLVQTIGTDPNFNSANFGVFYGYGYSVDPYAGQIFVEIEFKVAEDYLHFNGDTSGLLDVSDSVRFYRSEKARAANIKGIVYMLQKIENTFNGGKFIQRLHLLQVPEESLFNDQGNQNNGRETDGTATDAKPIDVRTSDIGVAGGGGRVSDLPEVDELNNPIPPMLPASQPRPVEVDELNNPIPAPSPTINNGREESSDPTLRSSDGIPLIAQ